MGASRMSENIFLCFKKYNGKRDWKRFWYLIRHFNKTTFDDTFMPIVCKIKGHNAYHPDLNNLQEWACKRCHNYIKWNPRKEKLLKLKKYSRTHSEQPRITDLKVINYQNT